MAHSDFQFDLSRRGFLRGTLGGAVFLQTAVLLPSGCAHYKAAGSGNFKTLDPKSAAIAEAIADAMVDPEKTKLPVPSEIGIAGRIDDMISGLHPDVQDQTKLLFRVVEHFPLVFGFHLSRFTKLGRGDQREYLSSWENSSIGFRKMAFQALKMFVYVNYYTFPETWDALGYDGPWVGRFEIPYYEPPLAKIADDEASL